MRRSLKYSKKSLKTHMFRVQSRSRSSMLQKPRVLKGVPKF